MERYLIEVEHEPDISACLKVVEVFLRTGSHFLTNADWGCKSGEHKAWIIVDLEGEEEARRMLPPEYRSQAKIVKLNKFTMEEMEELRSLHAS